MDPAAATIEIYKAGGLVLVLVAGFGLCIYAVWNYMRAQVVALNAALKAESDACRAREGALVVRVQQLESDGRKDLKELLVQSNDTAGRCADALHLAARAFDRLAESDSGPHRAIRNGRG